MAYTFKHGDRPLDGYTVQRGIGRGGFGEVYYAISDGGREVALKYLRDNAEIELRGVTHCMNLKSPHLVSIFDVKKSDDGDYFIIMEHVSGPSLAELLSAESSGLGMQKAAFFLREIGKGLAYLHDQGIVHRDLKPANIFYEEGQVKIGDYGLSKFISVSRHSAQTTSVGTVHYMAPEVGSGNYHRGIDLYALGVILYEMLLGKVPFEGGSMGEILMKHLTEQPEVTGLPEPFGKVIRKALEKDPKNRYQSVNEMIDDMLEVGSVRDSLAGFNTTTISSMPRRAAHEPFVSPVRSPNPPPPPPYAYPFNPGVRGETSALPDKVVKRLQNISRRVETKLDRLAGKRGLRHPGSANHPGASPGDVRPSVDVRQKSGFGRTLSAVVLTLAVSAALGLLIGLPQDSPEHGFGTGAMIVAMTLGLRLYPRTARWMGPSSEPLWVRKSILIACCLPLMAPASASVFAQHEAGGFALLLGMLVMILFTDWDSRRESGEQGELSFWTALWLAFWGGMVTVFFAGVLDVHGFEEHFMAMGAAIIGGVSLLTQALAWILGGGAVALSSAPVPADEANNAPVEADRGRGALASRFNPGDFDKNWPAGVAIPHAHPVEPGVLPSAMASSAPLPKARSMFERAFFSIVAFIMLFGVVINVIFPVAVSEINRDEVFAHVIAAVACLALFLFSAQKLTLRKRHGFWNETFCPFLLAVFMTTLGASIASIAILNVGNEELAVAIVGIIFSGLLLMVLFIARLWPYSTKLDKDINRMGQKADQWFKDGFVASGAFVIGDDDHARDDAPKPPPQPDGAR